MLFWHSAFQGNNQLIAGWDAGSILTYYLLIIIAGGLLISHIEDLLDREVRQGTIVKYLLKPSPLYSQLLLIELPYRCMQGSFAVLFYLVTAYFFPLVRIHIADILSAFIIFLILVCAFFLTHTYKMMLGMVTFWTKDNKGIIETSQVLVLLFAGFNLPLTFLPGVLSDIALSLPFAYFAYYPVISLQGKLPFDGMIHVLQMEILWLGIFFIVYKILLQFGLKKFTAVGQ